MKLSAVVDWKSYDRVRLFVVAALAALSLLASVFFRPVFGTWSFFVPPVVGAIIAALAVSVLCDRLALTNGFATAAHAVVFVLVVPGLIALPAARFGLPLPGAIRALFSAAIEGPARLLTSPIPARSEQELLVVPVLGTWGGFVVGWLLARRTRRVLALIGPTITLVVAIAFGPLEQSALRVATFAYAIGAFLYLVAVDRVSGRMAVDSRGRLERVRSFSPAVLTLVPVAAIGCLVGPMLPLASSRERFSLRTYRVPPFDINVLTSPLADYRKFLTPAYKDKVLFEASGDLPASWRLATLYVYDGRVWSVGGGESVEGTFALVGAKMDPRGASAAKGPNRSTTIRTVGLDEPFLPVAGKGLALSLPASTRSRIRHNPESDVLVWATGTPEQVQYQLTWRDVSTTPAAKVSSDSFGPSSGLSLALDALPDQIQQFASEAVEGASTDTDRAAQLQRRLVDGYYSLDTRPGHSYGDLTNLVADPAQMVGNEEQYTAAFGALARAVQIPVRLVVGFEPPKTSATAVKVRGRDIRTWAEVNYAGAGWVRYDVTPPKSRAPKPRAADNEDRVDAPPPHFDPLPQSIDQAGGQASTKQKTEKKIEKSRSISIPYPVKVAGGVIGVPTILGGALVGSIALMKARRRKRRRSLRSPSLRIAGAWDEAMDRLLDSGRSIPLETTFVEAVEMLPDDDPDRESLALLAQRSERAAFHPVPPSDDDSAAAWSVVDSLHTSIRSRVGRFERLRQLVRPKSLSRDRSPMRFRSAQ